MSSLAPIPGTPRAHLPRPTSELRTARALVADVVHRLDITTLACEPEPGCLGPNDIGRVRSRLAEPVFADPYRHNRSTGAAILIDETTNGMVSAALVVTDREDWP